ncbi:myosin-1-like isoform X2 [Plodia interpunctella]|uniref:myosin-1-like isoform X2 n=1 Tax=Plodia interpunctella TaxID=58824 RepID=UPI002368C1BA|nr:myosin-1-like isoform X2 [Plodia interpunctella]
MECITNSEPEPMTEENQKLKTSDSAENFQHFIYELFEKNGILNDLRAYLRGHIVDVLKSTQTGEPPTCQKYFMQRLDLANQALNILIAEYLLRYEFSYSLSVFISEIPLANMVFGLAKALMMKGDSNQTDLWFSDSDVWSILNYLGIKCDSVHASNIVEKYSSKDNPLLLCMLKSLPFYCMQGGPREEENMSLASITSEKSSESTPDKHTKHEKGSRHEKCKHYTYCKACQSRMHRVKEMSAKKKKHLAKMFNQLKTVYETEVEMVKQEEEKKYKQVLAKFALQLQKRQAEMEEKFKQREEELEAAVQQKKKFLWGLAQALRDQHQNMAAAMCCVRGESERLTAKEDSLKTQLIEAENMIKNRGEEMRAQIANEIQILEKHLESMRQERAHIDREKSDLDKFKTLCDSKIRLINDDSQLEELKKEIAALKKSFTEHKVCLAEKSIMTELESGGKMNNQEVGMKSDSEERVGRTPNQVVNDLKKQKNVNFNQSQYETSYQDNRRSQSTDGVEERDARRDARRDAIFVLQDENDRLKRFARQQEQHIDELNIQTARLQAELESTRVMRNRPRTAPALSANYEDYQPPRLNTSISATYSRFARPLAAGEHSVINVPHNTRRADSRRYLIQQWRALRLTSPTNVSREPHTQTHRPAANSISVSHSVDTEPMRETADDTNYYTDRPDPEERAVQLTPQVISQGSKARCKSPKSMLKEAKLKLRNKVERSLASKKSSQIKREKSPNSVLREAKLRLKKLEIEAEAVEKSYLDFRKKQTMKEEVISSYAHVENNGCDDVTLDVNIPNNDSGNLRNCKIDLDKFLNKYEKRFNIADFKNTSPNSRAKVIPESYVEFDKNNKNDTSYLETPLAEFRKLYSQNTPPSRLGQTKAKPTTGEVRSKNKNNQVTEDCKEEAKKKVVPINNAKELKILKNNISKIYNLQEPSQAEATEEVNSDPNKSEDKNMLRIEIESVTETNNLKLKESDPQDMFLVVQSPAETVNISISDLDEEISPRMTVLVSPKVKNEDREEKLHNTTSHNRAEDLEEPEKLNANDFDTIFQIERDVEEPKALEQQCESQPLLESGSDRDKVEDYVDDFSADVDNYNSRSDDGIVSPVSHVKTSEDENFWDS